MLLIFDNFEHVLEGAILVSAVLREYRQIKAIVTSCERLHVSYEFRRSLEVAQETNQVREIIVALYGMAQVHAVQGAIVSAIELLTVVHQHPISRVPLIMRTRGAPFQEVVEVLGQSLREQIAPETYAMILERSQALEFDLVVAEILQNQPRFTAAPSYNASRRALSGRIH